ncbi:MAG: alpha/beta fold hydrolase [Reichenbachiella sp.]|uniref:alpha/beta hydrolase n=1 Tax=Reichenbachiella sp. TaxID=2184521 RepID=UPI003263B009
MNASSFWIGVAVLLGVVFLYNLFFVLFYESFLFQGEPLSEDYKFSFDFQYEEVVLSPEPQVALHGIHLKSDSSKGIVIYFHGNRGNVSRWGLVAEQIRQYGYDVLLMDYRGYGKSHGERSEEALYRDANFIYDYAIESSQQPNVIIFGRSLGSAIATKLALDKSPDQLILETPMTRIRDVVPLLYRLLIYKPWMKYEFDSASRIEAITCPITVFHGTDDAIVPYELGKSLFDQISHSNKKLVTINQGKHNNLDTFESYQQAIGRILR